MVYAEIIFLLVSFIILLTLALCFAKKKVPLRNKNMQLMEVLPLNFNQYIYIIKVGTEYHLFCGGKAGMTYGSKLDKNSISFDENVSFNKFLDKWQKECKKDEQLE